MLDRPSSGPISRCSCTSKQRSARIPQLPCGHHRRFDFPIFYFGVPESGYAATLAPIVTGWKAATDNDVENLAATLPRLKCLEFSQPCGSNSCNTTVASLMSVSIHCLGLKHLETHFNTLTIFNACSMEAMGVKTPSAGSAIWWLDAYYLKCTERTLKLPSHASGILRITMVIGTS